MRLYIEGRMMYVYAMSLLSRYSGLFLVVATLVCSVFVFSPQAEAAEVPLTGWGWSSNIGWISFSSESDGATGGSAYSVKLNDQTGVISGFAWSNSVGWLSFNLADVAPCPLQTEDEGSKQARVKNMTGGGTREVIGWARMIN
ncbi:MAG: hypothetical protein RJA61_330, partial [Candidatus Parcubacteria bacterium]